MPSSKTAMVAFIAAAAGLASAAPNGAVDAHETAIAGDLTHYTPGLGACGQVHTDQELVVAIDPATYGSQSNPNSSPVCNKKIRIKYNGKSIDVTVVDKCPSCKVGDLDLSTAAFEQLVGDLGKGRVRGTWDWT